MKMIILAVAGIVLMAVSWCALAMLMWRSVRRGAMARTIASYLVGLMALTGSLALATTSVAYNYYYQEGSGLVHMGQYGAAVRPLDAASKIRNSMGKLAFLFDSTLLGFPLFFSTEEELHVVLGNLHKINKSYDRAVVEYTAILGNDPNSFGAMAGLAETYLLKGDRNKSAEIYARLVRRNPVGDTLEYHFELGKAYIVLEMCVEAERSLAKALEYGKNEEAIRRYLDLCRDGGGNRHGN